jgi:TPR repeat protein
LFICVVYKFVTTFSSVCQRVRIRYFGFLSAIGLACLLSFSVHAESFETSIDYTMLKLATEHNDPSAQYLVGRNYLKGKSVEKNIKEAIKWFEMAAKQGHIRSQYQLGKIYLYGEGIKANRKKAYYYLSKAAEQDHLESQYELGNYYLQGNPNRRQYEKAVHWFRRAANQDHVRSTYMLGKLMYEGKGTKRNIQKAKRLLKVASETGLPDATKYLAKIEQSGTDHFGVAASDDAGGNEDIDGTHQIEEIDGLSVVSLTPGDYYKQGIEYLTKGSKHNDKTTLHKAALAFQKAAEQGHGKAQYQLAKLYKQGIGVKQNEQMHRQWLDKAADAGVRSAIRDLEVLQSHRVPVTPKDSTNDPDKLYTLAMKYYNGEGVPMDQGKAASLLTDAANQNHADAQYQLGVMYRAGIGVAKDYDKAKHWLQKAYQNEIASAQLALKAMDQEEHQSAEAVSVSMKAKKQSDDPLASQLISKQSSPIYPFLKNARDGDASAQYKLGMTFLKGGDGIERDVDEALKWLKSSARNNNVAANLKLGMLYYKGIDVERDYRSAANWMEKAAKSGNANAQYMMGNFYRKGLGVDKNNTTAIKWYRKAANQGHREARKRLGGCRIC